MYEMIRRITRDCPPLSVPLLREAFNETSIRRNQVIAFQHALSFVPSETAQMVHIIRKDQQMKRMCKLLLLRKCIPLDLFEHIYPYFYDMSTYLSFTRVPRLPHRVFSRTIHHLIRSECISDVPVALEIGRQFDMLQRYSHIMRDFRNHLGRCMSPSNWNQLIGNATPEIWYLQGNYASWWIWDFNISR